MSIPQEAIYPSSFRARQPDNRRWLHLISDFESPGPAIRRRSHRLTTFHRPTSNPPKGTGDTPRIRSALNPIQTLAGEPENIDAFVALRKDAVLELLHVSAGAHTVPRSSLQYAPGGKRA